MKIRKIRGLSFSSIWKTGFYFFDKFAYRHCSCKSAKQVQMIFRTADNKGGTFMGFAGCRQVWMKFGSDCRGYVILTVFCAEYDMNQNVRQRLRHDFPPL